MTPDSSGARKPSYAKRIALSDNNKQLHDYGSTANSTGASEHLSENRDDAKLPKNEIKTRDCFDSQEAPLLR